MYYFPHESQAHTCTWMAFGMSATIWPKHLIASLQQNLADIALAIAQFEPVNLLVTPENYPVAWNLLGSSVNYVEVPLNDIWIRDSGANFVLDKSSGQLVAIDFNFNGWGNKQRHNFDRHVAKIMADYTNSQLIKANINIEGGSIEVNGSGVGIFTESSILNSARNPNCTRQQIEEKLKTYLGLTEIIWLKGIKGYDITDGHIDFYARFIDDNGIIISLENDTYSFDYRVTREHQDRLIAMNKIKNITILNTPQNVRVNRQRYPEFAASYVNYYLCQQAVIMPEFGDQKADKAAIEILTDCFPKRNIVSVNIDTIAIGGGGIHCVTQQQPKTAINP
ncbi:agmatine deiminase family protein [Arsenophonus nasoniae]|uniref:Agmatine deiminase family protein n=1 Tax=Arsenophonus nasoniae TaxID=638 RepID=A0AA95GNZ3_9GAMM|nr:agmatine deiminase family protein [Arsenophonus nasoniae]WGM01196.1 agmatine deiminase family protein [Arsenophonus nasoniae]